MEERTNEYPHCKQTEFCRTRRSGEIDACPWLRNEGMSVDGALWNNQTHSRTVRELLNESGYEWYAMAAALLLRTLLLLR